jgi:hypothetical protein
MGTALFLLISGPFAHTSHAVLTTIERDLLLTEVAESAIEFAIDELRDAEASEREPS